MESMRVTRDKIAKLVATASEDLVVHLSQYLLKDQRIAEAVLGIADTDAPKKRIAAPESLECDTYMAGESPRMQVVFNAIRRFAVTDVPVLISGETGTGKELAALAIHERSHAAAGPFIVVNCGALPPTLIAAELFGHEKGAFTGAFQRRIGRIEAAQGGTLFLDEIGDLPLELQPHLLRFVQQRTIERVGGNRPIEINARVIAATNVGLHKAVHADRFRQDLFYRLNVLTIHMPPLRDRGEDIILLAMLFLRTFAQKMGRPIRGFAHDALNAMREHPWPGNVRELISRVRRAITMTDDAWITKRDLGLDGADEDSPRESPRLANLASGEGNSAADEARIVSGEPLADVSESIVSLEHAKANLEESLIKRALARSGRNVTQAAQELGVSRVTFYRLMEKYHIRPHASGTN